jgi:hypothetical protein
MSEGEIVERALRAVDLRALVAGSRGRSDLDEDAAIRLVNKKLKAARAHRCPRAARRRRALGPGDRCAAARADRRRWLPRSPRALIHMLRR